MVVLKGLLVGTIPIAIGVLVYRYAYRITKFAEQLDAIGSKTPLSSVEPAEWNVMLTKGIAVMLVIFGGWVLFGAMIS